MRARFLLLSFVVLLALPGEAYAKKAELLMTPTRIVMSGKDRYVTVNIKNTGDATGQYSVSVIDMKMDEVTGAIVAPAEGEQVQYSAKDMLRISPKSMTLAPEQYQAVRIMLKKPDTLEAGEYRSHLRVAIDNDNTDSPGSDKMKEQTITVKAKTVYVIPIIIRNGEVAFTSTIIDPKLVLKPNNKPALHLTLTREGTRSSMGDIKVVHKSADGKSTVLQVLAGVPVYRPTTKRPISVPLDVPKDVDLTKGTLEITYTAQEKDGGTVLATAALKLQ